MGYNVASTLCGLSVLIHSIPLVLGRCDFPTETENVREQTMNCEGQTSVTFGFLADMGMPDGSQPHIAAIVNSFREEAADFDFVAMGGDNFYADIDGFFSPPIESGSGVVSVNDPLWDHILVDRFEMETMGLPWLATLGNHAYEKNAQAQIDYSTATQRGSPYWTMPANYYKMTIPNLNGKTIEMNMIDTTEIDDDEWNWLDESLKGSSLNQEEDVVRIVVGHHQIFSNGARGDACAPSILMNQLPHVLWSALTRSYCQNCENICNYHGFLSWLTGKRLADLLSKRQVSAYLCGHEHDMQILEKQGVHYFVVGGGGGVLRDNAISFLNRLLTLNFFGSSAKSISYENTYGYGVFTIDAVNMVLETTYRLFDREGNPLPSVSWTSPLKAKDSSR